MTRSDKFFRALLKNLRAVAEVAAEPGRNLHKNWKKMFARYVGTDEYS